MIFSPFGYYSYNMAPVCLFPDEYLDSVGINMVDWMIEYHTVLILMQNLRWCKNCIHACTYCALQRSFFYNCPRKSAILTTSALCMLRSVFLLHLSGSCWADTMRRSLRCLAARSGTNTTLLNQRSMLFPSAGLLLPGWLQQLPSTRLDAPAAQPLAARWLCRSYAGRKDDSFYW